MLSCQFDQARGTRSIEIFKAWHADAVRCASLNSVMLSNWKSLQSISVWFESSSLIMTRDPSAPLPPPKKRLDLSLLARFFDLAERYVYVAVATLLLLGAVATIGHALFIAIVKPGAVSGFSSPSFLSLMIFSSCLLSRRSYVRLSVYS